MRKIAIILCLIFTSLCANAAAVAGSGSGNINRHFNHPHYRHYQPNYYNGGHYYPRRFYRSGRPTGFSPPPYYNGNNYTYWNNGYPYYSSGFTLGDKIQEFFNKKFNNTYAKNPYVNGNYNSIQNPKTIEFFGMDNQGGGYNIYDDCGNLGGSANSGVTVKILD